MDADIIDVIRAAVKDAEYAIEKSLGTLDTCPDEGEAEAEALENAATEQAEIDAFLREYGPDRLAD